MPRFQNEYGIGFLQSDHMVFFGGKGCNEETLRKSYPEFVFRRIRQTHSSIVVASSETIVEADAHFSADEKTALVVATADCIPLMIFCRQTLRAAAVHAGWRGIQSQITTNTLSALASSGSTRHDFIFYVGPHILQKSFQTDADVFQALVAAHPGLDSDLYSKFTGGKYYLNLGFLMEYQIKKFMQKFAEIFYTDVDTMTCTDFHSYRRGKHSSERNLSFIARL